MMNTIDLKIVEIAYDDKRYPSLLKTIKNPPKILYCIGNIELLNKEAFAVVGTRKPSSYGKWVANKIAQRLAENEIVTVSGLALGIDSCAHRGALNAKGETIAVLGSGIDICFPSSNKALYDEIRKHGLVISEYPSGFKPARYTFPMRNRIISGISKGTVVVEAGMNSGSLITAELANEQCRALYAVPGNITSPMSLGTNQLIADGVTPLTVIDELIEDLCGNIKHQDYKMLENLGADEKDIIKIISSYGEISINQLSEIIEIPVGKLNGILTVLEIKGMIRNSMGKIFIAK